jgi:hypothetical protein
MTFCFLPHLRVPRCGGCCSHELLSCQPVESETVTLSVVRTKYKGELLQYDGKQKVMVKKDKKCACDCKVKQEVRLVQLSSFARVSPPHLPTSHITHTNHHGQQHKKV